MEVSPKCIGSSPLIWRSVIAASILLASVAAAVFLMTVRWHGSGDGSLYDGQWTGGRRQRRDVGQVADTANADAESSTASTPDRLAVSDLLRGDSSGDYFPVYRQIDGGSVDWDSEQMSTEGFDVQSSTDFIDDETASSEKEYDYIEEETEDDPETSKSDPGDLQTDDLQEEEVGENANSSSPRGKEFTGYYAEADVDDGQKFDEDEYETTFIQPGMHYGDNVEIVEQVATTLCWSSVYPSVLSSFISRVVLSFVVTLCQSCC